MLPYGYHIKKSDTSINMEEPQPHDSQNRIIKPSDYRYTTTPIPIIPSFPLI